MCFAKSLDIHIDSQWEFSFTSDNQLCFLEQISIFSLFTIESQFWNTHWKDLLVKIVD